MASVMLRTARSRGVAALLAATSARSLPAVAPSGYARCFASEAAAQATDAAKKSGSSLPYILGLAGLGGGLYYAKQQGMLDAVLGAPPSGVSAAKDAKPDYGAVRRAIADIMEKDEDYDDGHYGPILVRLAWHASGSYDKASNTGGSNGATMRYKEGDYGANAGLKVARDLLEPIKVKFPWISYADLWTLAGATAIEEMGGPEIKWRPGRTDYDDSDETKLPPDGRLPDASRDAKHIRDVFYRMGFNDQEIVALSGAHSMGRCHPDRSGFEGPWTNSPTGFSNLYFQELLEKTWVKRKWKGPLQYQDKESKSLMMLPTDMWLIWDKKLKPYVQKYAKDDEAFNADFAAAFAKLLELGVPAFGEAKGEVAPPGLQPNLGRA
jgi:cytochrome c peroxidase